MGCKQSRGLQACWAAVCAGADGHGRGAVHVNGIQNGSLIRRLSFLCWYWAPPLAYATLIFALSSVSHPEETLPSFLTELGDKTLHLAEYGVLGALCYRAFRYAAGVRGARYSLTLAILAAALYGVTDEVHQAFVPLREASAWDWLADTVGATVGVIGWRYLSED
ncbi:MAG: VanZ family protein [Nitrospirota bacterium]